MKQALSLALVTLIVFSMLSILQIGPVVAAADEYFIYSQFDPPGIGDVVGVGGYVEYYGVPEWGDEIQYVYFLSGTTGYKVKITVTDGDGDGKIEPRQHPNHYLSEFQGPIEPRHFEIVSSANLAGYTSGSGGHTEEFYVDSGGVYLGAYSIGIHKWDHDWNFLGKIANRPPQRTESMTYNAAENVWYAGGRYRTIYQLSDTDSDGSFLDESWTAIFTYPSYGGSHHDGMEYVGGYLWISDMTSDVIGKWEYDTATSTWTELKRFTYSEPADVEGMGFGPNDHFWCGSGWGSGSYIYELGNEITKGYPLAKAGLDVDAYPPEISITFYAGGSHHTDPSKNIVLYEWDYETDGTWDYIGTDLIVEHAYPASYVLAELVKTVIGADYLWGGKGWDLNEERFVEPEEIKEGYNYWNPEEEKIDFGSGLDCSGLAFWSFNKMVNTANYEDSLLPESAQGQWEACDKIDKEDLRLGDLLFFDEYPVGDGVMNHVAMYLEAFNYEGEEYNVVHASGFTNTITPANYDPENEMLTTLKTTGEEQTIDVDGYGRVTEAPAPDSIIDWDKTAKDYTASLRVTDDSDPPLQDTDTCIIHITRPPWKPVADPNGPYEGSAGSPVQLDGSQSYDPESRMFPPDHPWYETIATYDWDLDNDGEFDDVTGARPTHTWGNEGLYIIGLKVTDSQPSGLGGTFGPLDSDERYTTIVISKALARVTVTVVEVRAIDSMDPLGGDADFYAKVTIDGVALPDSDTRNNMDDIYPEWSFSRMVSKVNVPIHIEIWDSDLVFDDHVDIDKDSNDRDLDFVFDMTTESLSGDIAYGYSRGEGESNRAEIWFNVGLGTGDKDGDGLFDSWETTGIHMDDDGFVDLDLHSLGASPDTKDLFLEIDWMQDQTHSHRPRDWTVNTLTDAFANAPVSNPDGSGGIVLHIDRSNNVAHQPVPLGSWLLGGLEYDWSDFDVIKANNFDQDRRFVYRFTVFVHSMPFNPILRFAPSGIAEVPGNDFIVSLGDSPSQTSEAGTLIHELGHTLNLRHGGGDDVNYKPNYLSIMNYYFQHIGIPPTNRIDYSRIALPSLDERTLNENLGIQDGADNTIYYLLPSVTTVGFGLGPIDWDNDLIIETSVQADINGNGQDDDVLTGYDDWANVLLNVRGQTDDFADGVHTSFTIEPDLETLISLRPTQIILKFAEGPAAVTLRTKKNWNFTIMVTNVYDYEIYNLIVSDHFGANLDVAFLSSTKGIYTQYANKPGRQQRFTWTIESLAPFETVTLKLEVSTGLNPAKKQEFTSAGLKILNSGATVKWVNASGRQGSAESGQVSIWAGVSVSDTAGAIAGYVTSVGEPLRGYVIDLRDSSGTLVATTTTDKNGFYGFSSLAPTDYSVICLTQSYIATVKAEQVKRIDFEFD